MHTLYCIELERKESFLAQALSEAAKNRSEAARNEVFSGLGNNYNQVLVAFICKELGPLLYDLADENINDNNRKDIIKVIKKSCRIYHKNAEDLLNYLKLIDEDDLNLCFPVDSKRQPIQPSRMNV